MGGLCVSIAFDGRDSPTTDVKAMVAAAPHRGLDGTGVWSSPGAALAHQRTHLLPEDAAVAQPITADGLVLVADARIDNRDDLLPLLSRSGYLVESDLLPDAEVVLAAYRMWGRGCGERLIGDYAFVIWDERRRRLLAARDPMGMRALHFRWEARRRLLVATEIKQVLAAEGVPREVHEAAVVATVAGPYLPVSWTAYAGIQQLPPGHLLEVDPDSCRTAVFWQPDPGEHFASTDPPTAADTLRETLAEAVRVRLRSTKPVGIFLSGGMDSGSVASLAGWLAEQGRAPAGVDLHTYSWAFDTLPDSDERGVSDHINRRYGLRATAFPAQDSWPLAGYPDHAPDEDDPYSWVYQALMERTLVRCRSDGVGTVLNGDRGDEMTGDWVFDELGMLRAGHLGAALTDIRAAGPSAPVRARTVLRPVLQRHVPRLTERRRSRRQGGPSWPSWVPDQVAVRHDLGDLVAEARRPSAFGGAARSLRHQRAFSAQSARIAVLRERTRARVGMGFADPYSDRRVVQLVLSMPQWLLQRRTQPKALARAAMVGVMPEQALLTAQKTIPYSFFDHGFRDRAVPTVESLLTGSHAAARGWLDVPALERVYGHYVRTGQGDDDFWWPLTVEMWLRRWWS